MPCALRILLLLPVLLSVSLDSSAADKRPVTHEDVWTMKRLGAPVVSPDGSKLVVSVSEPHYDEDKSFSDLWLVDVNGRHEPVQLTHSKETESDVAWSPDGSRIAFSAARVEDEPAQIYVLNMAGPGEAEKITSLSTGASKPLWSPDGQTIAFESRVYPGAIDDEGNAAEKRARDERKYNVSAYDIFPIRQWDRWRDDLQTHLFVQEATSGAEPRNLLLGSELVSAPGFGGVESLSGDSLEPAWAPDGNSLVISATSNLDEAAHSEVNYQLYRVAVGGGDVSRLTASDDWSCHSAQLTANGRSLYCLLEPHTGRVYEATELARFDWSDGPIDSQPDILTASFDRAVGELSVGKDDSEVFLTAHDEGRTRVFRATRTQVRALDAESNGVYSGVGAAGRYLVARWESAVSPAEIVRIDRSRGTHQALTNFNAGHAAQLDRHPYREFWFENAKGLRVHNYVALPPQFDETKKYPLVLMIHGGPFSSSRDAGHVRWSPHLLAAPGYVVLMTDYTGSVGYGEAFSQAIEGSPLADPGDDLLQAVDEAIERYPFVDGSRLAATGASYGGHLVNWLQATTDRFDALVGHAGLVDLEGQYSSSDTVYHREIMNGGPAWESNPVWSEQSPASHAGRFTTPILLTIGEKDFRVPINQTIAAWTYVQRMRVPGRLLVFHDANHWIMQPAEAQYYWQEVHEWLGRYLSDASAVPE